ncbi:ABC transporter permease [Enterococcus termitis]|uniref:ABC transporter permease n=1 Tax=Enterococcus termitis TaxID=332950 RepID=A0A1E5GSU1_9ENTE|nr:ABC transporter permease [Enterococcus termitis]OEG15752.1 ABC transporter permease [Enterococcus termitis]OJG96634.1 permease [Enterococcus termitis]
MNFIKRALLSMKAKKGRTFLLCAVFSAILIFVLAGLTIQSAALTATENAKKSVGATVTISANREAAMKKNQESSSGERPDPGSFSLTPVSLTDAQKIAELANVKSYSFLSSSSAGAGDGITPISSESDETATSESSNSEQASEGKPNDQMQEGGQMGGGPMSSMKQSDFQVSGVMDLAMVSAFSEGTAEITSGEAISDADEDTNNVVIEETLAEANDLSVGDTFKITDPEDEEKTYELTIKGIYKTAENGDSMGMMFNFLNPANTLYTSYTFANTLKGEDSAGTIDSASYTLEDPKEMDSFVEAAEKLIDTESFSLQTNDQAYQQMLQPLNNVASFAKNIVILVAVAGVIILTLIVMMTIRERRYEIGVLLSLGESRLKVILQFFSEIIVCMVVALVIATFSGNIVGNVVGEQLIDQQTQTAQQSASNQAGPGEGGGQQRGGRPDGGGMGGGMGRLGASSAEAAQEIEKLNISVKPKEIAILAGLGVLISFFSIVLSSVGILRLQPKKILTT